MARAAAAHHHMNMGGARPWQVGPVGPGAVRESPAGRLLLLQVRTWSWLMRVYPDALLSEQTSGRFWTLHMPSVVAFAAASFIPAVERWTGVPGWVVALAVTLHVLIGALANQTSFSSRRPQTASAMLFFGNMIISGALVGAPGHFVAPVWGLYFIYPMLSVRAYAPSILAAITIAVEPLVISGFWHVVGSAPLGESFGPLMFVSIVAAVAYVSPAHFFAAHRRDEKRDADERVGLAAFAERQRIARELHDTLGAGLAEIGLWLDIGRNQQDGVALDRARRRLGTALTDLRASVSVLADGAIDGAQLADLVEGRVRDLCEAAGVELAFRASDPPEAIPAAIAQHVLHIAIEACANALRHGKPRRIDVVIRRGRAVGLCVEDDGCGFDPAAPQPGHGLASMRARAAALGAPLEIVRVAERGTRVTLGIGIPTVTGA